MNKLWPHNSIQLLREIDRKMSIIEFILRQISVHLVVEEVYEIPQLFLEVSQLLHILQQDSKMTPLAKELSLQLQNIQEQYNRLFGIGRMH